MTLRIDKTPGIQRTTSRLVGLIQSEHLDEMVVWCKGFLYQAASWKTARRVVAKVDLHFGELFPRVGFIVTNLNLPGRAAAHPLSGSLSRIVMARGSLKTKEGTSHEYTLFNY
jgi:hypothetical protein